MNIGMILVLFILLVIVAQTLCKEPLRAFPLQPDNGFPSITASRRFDIRNDSSYLLNATLLTGGFEPPPPSLHSIRPGGSYAFEVLWSLTTNYYARVAYDVIDGNGAIVGELKTVMSAGSGPSFEHTTTTGPIAERNSLQTMRVYNI